MAKRPAIWVICYVKVDRLHTLSRDLYRYSKYKTIEAFIPQVKVLKKQFKGKKHYEEVPLLLNYGFFRVPEYFIPNYWFLEDMRKEVECVYNWLRDPALASRKDKIHHYRFGIYNPSGIAIATEAEIEEIRSCQKDKSIYTAEDLKTLYPGKIITLHGYPFDDLEAEIIRIDEKRKEVEVRLLLHTSMSKVKVSFDNIFYTIYQNNYLETAMKEQSIEEIAKNKNTQNIYKDGN